jgi:hypothetical protein
MADITLNDLIETAKAAFLGNTTAPIVLVPGDPILAILQAGCLADLLVLQAIEAAGRRMRASTSVGVDLDTWLDDFGFERLSAKAPSGEVTFTVNDETGANIPVGSTISSSNNSAVYSVVADLEHMYFDSVHNRYEVPIGISSVNVPVLATLAGIAYNVGKGVLTNIVTPVSGVTAVTNNQAIANGLNVEGDPEARARFKTFILSLGRANESSIILAIQSVLGANADFVLLENSDASGNDRDNFFTVVAENGSGSLSDVEQSALIAAINKVKGFPINFDLTTPTVITIPIEIEMLYDAAQAMTKAEADAVVVSSIINLINSKRIGQRVYFSECVHAIMKNQTQYPIIVAVPEIVINGVHCDDYTPGPLQLVRTNGESVTLTSVLENFPSTGDVV